MSLAASPPHLQISIDSDALPDSLRHAAVKRACRQLLSAWDALSDEDIEVSFIAGGISNALYKVTPTPSSPTRAPPPAPPPPPVAFRVYGANTDRFVDRERELELMRVLHAHSFGPQLLGTFSNGRIESFLPMRCLSPHEMASPAYAPAIGATLAKFHSVMPGRKPAAPATPFGRIRNWLEVARGLDFSDAPSKAAAHSAFDFDRLGAAVDGLEAAAARAASPVVFSHNDLLSGNIMVPLDAVGALQPGPSEGTERASGGGESGQQPHARAGMTFIDFEYSDWAPRGYDWGNHFCEYAGFDCDYSRYPGSNEAAPFLRAYLAASTARAERDVADDEVAAALVEANLFALASHLYWGAWALMQARWSTIDFDYMSYTKLRWGEYERRRDEFLAAADALFPAEAAAEREAERS